jgi:hypothetical protein
MITSPMACLLAGTALGLRPGAVWRKLDRPNEPAYLYRVR